MSKQIPEAELFQEIQSLRSAGHQGAALLLAEDRLRRVLENPGHDPGAVLDWGCVVERLCRETSQNERAKELRARAIQHAKSQHGCNSREFAAVLERIASQLLDDEPVRWYREWPTHRQDDYDAALALLEEAVRIRVIALGARSHAFDAAIQALKFVAKSNESVVDSQVVTEELRHAIAVVENFATEENIQMAHSHFVLEAAQALKAMARANECVMFDAAATSDLQRAIAYLEQYAGRDHIEVSRCLALLSRRFRLEQNNESAVRVAREALRIAQLHGQRSADLAIALNALGMALIDAGNLVDGMNHLRDSFEMMERINDWNEPFADVSFLYGRQLLRLGRFRDANRCLTIASRIYERRLVPEHRRRINALVLLGRSFAGIGELHEARRRFHQASLDAERLRREPSYLREDADEEEFANVCLSLVNANAEIGDFDESDRLLDIVCEISSDLIGREVGDVRNEYEYKDEAEDAVEEINERGWRIAHLAGPAEVISLLRKDAKDRALELTRWLLQGGDWVCNLGVDDPPYPVGHLHEVLSFALLRVNDRTGAVEAIAKAVHACQCERSIDEIRLAELLNVQGYVLRESGQEEAASSCEERALTIYQRIGHMRAVMT